MSRVGRHPTQYRLGHFGGGDNMLSFVSLYKISAFFLKREALCNVIKINSFLEGGLTSSGLPCSFDVWRMNSPRRRMSRAAPWSASWKLAIPALRTSSQASSADRAPQTRTATTSDRGGSGAGRRRRPQRQRRRPLRPGPTRRRLTTAECRARWSPAWWPQMQRSFRSCTLCCNLSL